MKHKMNKSALVAMSVAGLVAAAGFLTSGSSAQAMSAGSGAYEACHGINACKGTGACGGASHSCAGLNACKGQGWVQVAKDTCLKIQGGRLTA